LFDQILPITGFLSLTIQQGIYVQERVRKDTNGWKFATIAHSQLPKEFKIHITAYNQGVFDKVNFQVDSITVLDRTVQNILPIAATGFGVCIITLYVIVSAWRERRK
jgi:hypothetical protein